MKELIRKYKWPIIFALAGMIAGYTYWHFVGCASGTCLITSKWLNSTAYGGIVGVLIGNSFIPKTKEDDE
ncbi:hypothetical protein EMN47_10530 [Prolixibacteraceae bacterium JC049]|nr:hypothetical protein [Prolixibacteraceae bacterium JC049]